MKALVEMEPVQAPALLGELRELPLASLRESPWNPRQYFSETSLDELTESIKGKGITTPLIVRPSADGFEIGAGARRFRAAKKAGLHLVPCIVRVLDDQAFLELISFENLSREDPHPLEEAAGFQNYIHRTHCSVMDVVKKTGVSRAQVYARLKLRDLIPEAERACYDGKISASHATLISRLQPKEQEKALKYCCAENLYRKPSERELREWIASSVCLEMKKAPWDLSDQSLVPDERKGNREIPGPGSCTDCKKRTINDPDLYPEATEAAIRKRVLEEGEIGGDKKFVEEYIQGEVARADACTDPGCFHRKLKAHLVRIELQAKQKHGPDILKISTGYKGKGDILGHEQYEIVTGKAAQGPNVKTAVVVQQDRAYGSNLNAELGQVVQVRIKPKPKAAPERDWRAEQKKRDQGVEREKGVRRKILEAIFAKVTQIDRDDIACLIQGHLEESRGDGEGVLAQILGAGSGGAKAIAKQLPKWHGKDLGKAIVGAAVASELSGWFKCEMLLAIAKRYKVDAAKIRASVEAEIKQQEKPATALAKALPGAKTVSPATVAARKNSLATLPAKKAKSRTLHPSARRRIAAAQKRRWALHRKLQAKKGN